MYGHEREIETARNNILIELRLYAKYLMGASAKSDIVIIIMLAPLDASSSANLAK